MKITKEYNEKELTVKIEDNIDTVTAPENYLYYYLIH